MGCVSSPLTITVESEFNSETGASTIKYITSDSNGNGGLFGCIDVERGSTLTIFVDGDEPNLLSHPLKITEFRNDGHHGTPRTDVTKTDLTEGPTEDHTYSLTWVVPCDETIDKYQYQCENHAGMRGTINVLGVCPSPTPTPTATVTPTASITTTPSITISPTISPTPSQEPGIQLTPLDNDIDVTVVGFNYVFDNKSSIDNQFGINLGTYTFRNVPQSHAIGFYRKDKPVRVAGMSYADQHIGNDGNTYDYYYGDVVLDVTGDFGVMSYDCINHGFMGGENNLIFDSQATQFASQGLTVTLDYTNYTENALSSSDQDTIRSMADSFEEVILTNQTFPIDVTNFTQVTPGGGGTLAYAGKLSSQYLTSVGDPNGPYGIGYWQSTAGFMAIDPNDVNTLRQVTSEPNKNTMYWVMLHEVGHAFGIGFWNTQLFTNNGTVLAGIADNLIRLTEADGAQYIGEHAVREYNKLVDGNFASLPIQTFLDTSDPDPNNNDSNAKIAQNFTSAVLTQQDINNGFILHNDPWRPSSLDVEVPIPSGTVVGQTFNYTLYLQWGGHWAELTPDSGQRTLDGELQPYITEELMTPYINIPSVAPMTRITLGFLHDLGFLVDYSKIDPNS